MIKQFCRNVVKNVLKLIGANNIVKSKFYDINLDMSNKITSLALLYKKRQFLFVCSTRVGLDFVTIQNRILKLNFEII